MKNLGPSFCGSNQMQAFQARVCNLAKMGAVPHKNSMATRRLHYGGMAEMQCWLRPSQVPQPTCYWKWHSWQLGNLTSLLQMPFPPSPIGEPAFQLWSNVEKPASGKLILPWFHGSNKFNWSKMLNFPISEELVNSSKFQIREGKGSFEGKWKVLLLLVSKTIKDGGLAP